MTALITYPSSVGLAERHVQVILNCYRAVLQYHPKGIMKWDSYLKGIVNSINPRVIRVYGFCCGYAYQEVRDDEIEPCSSSNIKQLLLRSWCS